MTREEALEAALLKCGQYIGHAGDCALVSMCQPCDCNMDTALYNECMAALAMPKDEACKSCKECCSDCEKLCEREACRCEECKAKDRARLLRVAEAAWNKGAEWGETPLSSPRWIREDQRRVDLAAIVEGVK